MAASPSRALAKRNVDSALMPPPPAPKRQKRPAKVLDEDVYSNALSNIIARDFFPGLLEADAQTDYLDALESHNSEWIREAGKNLTQIMTPRRGAGSSVARGTRFATGVSSTFDKTPSGSSRQTPGQTPHGSDVASVQKEEINLNLSLGEFQSKYTSEDNESFNALLDKQNRRRSEKYAFFHHGNNIPSARQIAYRSRERKLLEDENGLSTSLVAVNVPGQERRLVTAARPSKDLDARPASVDSFRDTQGARNSFMFDPESVEDSTTTIAQVSEQRSNAPPKAVQYAATRFPPPQAEDAVPPSPSMSAIDEAIAGRPRASASETGYSGAETPRVNGYAFVDAEPTPEELGMPVTDQEAEQAEQEAAAHFLPKVNEGGPNPFKIASPSKREDLHMRLVEKGDASRRKGGRLDQLRDLGITPGRTPTPKFTSGPHKRGAAMTPAAQRLAEKIKTPRRKSGMFESTGQGNASWTPTPRVRRSG